MRVVEGTIHPCDEGDNEVWKTSTRENVLESASVVIKKNGDYTVRIANQDIDENFSKDGKILQQNVKEVVLSMLGIKVTAWLAECFNNNIGNFPNIIYYPITTINGSRIDF